MAIGISPLVDFAFKRVFGNPEHTDITLHFLNAILAGHWPRITHIELMNPFLEKDWFDDKLAILDISAVDETGCRFTIEMQAFLPAGMEQRMAYYTACRYVEQMHEGEQYVDLRPAITICVLNQILFPQVPDLHLDFRLREVNHGLTLTDDVQIHFLELPKLALATDNVEGAGPLEKWAYFLRHAEQMTPAEVAHRLTDPEYAAAAGVLEMISRTPEERRLYDARRQGQLDEEARMLAALQAGLKQGKEEGREQGREEGREEERIQLLQELLGLPISSFEAISFITKMERDTLVIDLKRRLRERQ